MAATIAIAVAVLSALGAALALVLVWTERLLGARGSVALRINEAAPTQVAAGQDLLSLLRERGVFVPSACGGRGSCGLCKVQVLEGGGPLLPTEEPHLSAPEREQGWRLACQIKVRTDLAVRVPEPLLGVREYTVTVEAIEALTHDIRRVRLSFEPGVAFRFRAGQYVQLETPVYDGLAEPVYRAYSIASPPSRTDAIDLIIRKVPRGICTTYVHELLLVGDRLRISGPFGDFYLRDTPAEAVFIAGGSGLAPFESILADMAERGMRKKATLFFGAVSRRDLYDLDRLESFQKAIPAFRFVPALSHPDPEDGWEGETGLITDVVARHYGSMEGMEAYLCGSPGMIDACVRVLTRKGLAEDRIYYDKFA